MPSTIKQELLTTLEKFNNLGIANQLDYNKFYLYSIITHSTAIEGSTVTEIENQLLFDEGISAHKPMAEQLMNLDLKAAYEKSFELAKNHTNLSVELLCELSALVMKNTGTVYKNITGEFSSAKGDLRLVNVSAGRAGKSNLDFQKVPQKLEEFCKEINSHRKVINPNDVYSVYELSFDVHYLLVQIHPWADGNGRMSRLIMNQLQMEFGVIPSCVNKEDKASYIASLVQSEENDDIMPFRNFMFEEHIKMLNNQIDEYSKSINVSETKQKITNQSAKGSEISSEKKVKSSEKILNLLRKDSKISASKMAEEIGISSRAVEKQLAQLKNENKIIRVGSDKGGHWEIVKEEE